MTERKRRIAELDAKMIEFYRKNPCIACEDLLGIKLLDSQNIFYNLLGTQVILSGAVVETLANHSLAQYL